jgi:hypothetical protein
MTNVMKDMWVVFVSNVTYMDKFLMPVIQDPHHINVGNVKSKIKLIIF